MRKNFSLFFVVAGLFMLILGAFIGCLSSLVYIIPDFLKEYIPFNQLRPMHITSVISWIILTATGGVYFYLGRVEKIKLYSTKLATVHFIIFIVIAFGIAGSYLTNQMGGREYLVFNPLLMLPILLGWFLFAVNYFKSVVNTIKNWPVYLWMFAVGIIFMMFHLSESNFWIFDHFRDDYIRDVTVQWKSYGSFVGSWNMLVYGTAMFLMTKIRNDVNIARGRTTFFFFFLGLTNLMFGWAHHTYIIPTLPWVRYVAYGISMTEWIIFIKIVYSWSKSLTKKDKQEYSMVYRFILASDFWVFVNLVMALLMSIPALNYFSHGTHITVAHSMGTTIGINTCVLFASVSFIVTKVNGKDMFNRSKKIVFYLFNLSLLIFWVALIAMGVFKIIWEANNPDGQVGVMHAESSTYYAIFIVAGSLLFICIFLIAYPMIKALIPHCKYALMPAVVQREIDHIKKAQES